MSTITQETPYYHVIEKQIGQKAEARAVGVGSELHTTYFEFRFTNAVVIEAGARELSDNELLLASEKSGTFDFLDAPEEDGYNDLLKKRE